MLSGNLAEFPLLRLLETLMGAARGGALFIEHPNFSGCLYLAGGHPVHAEAGSLRGLEALELLAGVRAAPFRFESEAQTQERSIEPSLQTHQLILHQFEAWKEISLPDNWGLLLQARTAQGQTQLSPLEVGVLTQAEGKTLAQALMNPRLSPLETAQVLSKFLRLGLLEARLHLEIRPEPLVVLSLYGGGQGVAVIDEDLYARWQGLLGGPFRVRLRTKHQETTLRPEPRINMQGRLGLFERDLRQLRLSRGMPVEAWPEAG
ncbi:MAG: DUF4388 domain-containing protein [Meiothermus sp.]|uniref:DUF4388 domain-containing protein n=1 Tax=Meiothermus sp. TaxID=1955249 RepID=UPI0025EAD432|nr:DUF4388 domain-containing protein [Meiothermus sp.]MCS7069418.1 DUF4388 domain-containing protein [Meiothermus sp.]MDW8426252.1 DUF4388 domain-containing protein [Meiothermus sp.]